MNSATILSEEISKPLGIYFETGSGEIFIHAGIVTSFIIAFIIVILSICINVAVKRADPQKKPGGLVLFGEFIVTSINKFTVTNLGENKIGLAPYLATLGIFLVIANLSGLLGFVAPTSDFNVTFTLALITIVLAQYHSIKDNGFKGYLKTFKEPFVFMLPNNILDLITTPLSMAMRLFGNILAGAVVMSLVYGALGYVSVFVAPLFHGYFDVFAGLIQAYVFVLLTAVVIEG